MFEILSWSISLVCMVGVVCIYAYLKDKPIPNGDVLTYANALGKIASAALIVPTSEALGQLKWSWFRQSNAMWDFEIFDKASRGPWGAIMLLFRTKGRSLAALGALLILLLLAIDTFFQQVVAMPTRNQLDGRASMLPELPWTMQYRSAVRKVYRDGVEMNMPDSEMQLVVDKFAFGNGSQQVPFGNGTRPDIPLVRSMPSVYATPKHSILIKSAASLVRPAIAHGLYMRLLVFAAVVRTFLRYFRIPA